MTLLDRAEAEHVVRLSPIQEGILFHCLHDGDSSVYTSQLVIDGRGTVHVQAFRQALAQVIARNDGLRSVFRWEKIKVPARIVLKQGPLDLQVVDVSDLAPPAAGQRVEALVEQDRRRPFDLSRSLFRVTLILRPHAAFSVILSNHHILYDGWSTGIIVQELFAAYEGALRNPGGAAPAPKPLHRYVSPGADETENMLSYWRRHLDGYEVKSLLPPPRNEAPGGFGCTRRTFDRNRLESFARRNRVTAASVLYTALGVVLQQYLGAPDVVIGTTVSVRDPQAIRDRLVGLFIQTVPLRIGEAPTVHQLLQAVNAELLSRQGAENVPESEVRKAARVNPGVPLFEAVMVVENYPLEINADQVIGGLQLVSFAVCEYAHYPLTITVSFRKDAIGIEFNYKQRLFDAGYIEGLSTHLLNALEQLMARPDAASTYLEVLSAGEKEMLLHGFNRPPAAVPPGKLIFELFEEQAARTPDRVALVYEDHCLTYGELDRRATGLARRLQDLGVAPDRVVGVLTDRSLEMMVGLLGVLKAGGAYLPIDPANPDPRIHYMLTDGGVHLLLVSEPYAGRSNGACREISLGGDWGDYRPGQPLQRTVQAHHLVYVIYTSGSTGTPKGVQIEHHSLMNRLWWTHTHYPIHAGDTFIQKTTYSFDVSVWELFWWCMGGARLVLPRAGAEKDPPALTAIVYREWVTTIHFVPSMLQAFLGYLDQEPSPGLLKSLRRVFASGEALTKPQTQAFRQKLFEPGGVKLINMYGPTEAAIEVSSYECFTGDELPVVPIGKPIHHVQLHVVDKHLRLVPVGVPGELCIAGVCLARGYVNKEQLTREKFVANPFAPGQRMYKTGDLARWLPDGNIEYLGRLDAQVKIRGYRIELGEIESQLGRHPLVREAAVVARSTASGEKELVAYYASDHPVPSAELTAHLARLVPHYMVPAHYVRMEAFPLTPSGKLDRLALPAPQPAAAARYVAPRNEVEARLAEVWAEVLCRQPVGITDNFFLIGGDSIKSIQIASRLLKYGYRVSVQDIFTWPTIEALGSRLRVGTAAGTGEPEGGPVPLTPIQRWFFEQGELHRHHFNQAVLLSFPNHLPYPLACSLFGDLQAHHEALRMQYREEAGQLVQQNQDLSYPVAVVEHDFRTGPAPGDEDLQRRFAQLQGSIDLANGPLLKAGLFHLPGGSLLLIVIHHLVVDGISWRILLEDLDTLYRRQQNGTAAALPAKTTSFRTWARKLADYAQTRPAPTRAYWEGICAEPGPEIPEDYPDGSNQVSDARRLGFELDEQQTLRLLTATHGRFGTQINDLLLSGLAIALRGTFGLRQVKVDLEGHGREEIDESLDVSRTVGWFTTLFPVVLRADDPDDYARVIKATKEHLRNIPNNGLDYGVLAYLDAGASRPAGSRAPAQICFNYLGQFDHEITGKSFAVSPLPVGPCVHPDRRRDHEIEIIGMVKDRRLRMEIVYSGARFAPGTLGRFSDHYREVLLALTDFCAADAPREFTPSDFTYRNFPGGALDRVLGKLAGNVQEIYPLTPLQKGILLEVLKHKQHALYVQQVTFDVTAAIAFEAVQQAFRQLLERHELLRSSVYHQDVAEPFLVVHKTAPADVTFVDVSGYDDAARAELAGRHVSAGRLRPMPLDAGSLVRLQVIKRGPSAYTFAWSFHHLVMDGWCMGILSKEFFEVYHALLGGNPPLLPWPEPYRAYLAYTRRLDPEKAAQFWRGYLAGYRGSAGLPQSGARGPAAVGFLHYPVNGPLTRKLAELQRKNNVTMSSLLQTAWGVLLARYNHTRDVVFGTVLSGRYPAVRGIGNMVGLFLNTIPVRVRFEPDTPFIDLVVQVQREALACSQYQYYPLADILAGTDRNLIRTLIVFENFPVETNLAPTGQPPHPGMVSAITNHQSYVHTNYELYLTVDHGETLHLTFKYNPHGYPEAFVGQLADAFTEVLRQLADDPSGPVAPMAPANANAALLEQFMEEL
jgi:iturin family lipopeptide synthetase B